MATDELIYNTLLEMKEDMGRFIAKCDAYDDQLDGHDTFIDKHDIRLRRLEQAILPIYGLIAAATTWGVAKFLNLIGKHP